MAKDTAPLEKQSYSKTIFWVNLIWVLVTAWAVYDEVEVRRPWKGYQRAFFALETQKLDTAIDKARNSLEKPEVKKEREKIFKELEAAESVLKSPEYSQAMERYNKAEIVLQEVEQEYTFAKSEYDEAYYYYKRAQHIGGDPAPYKARLDKLKKLMSALEAEIAKQTGAFKKEEAEVGKYTGKIKEFESRLEGISKELENLQVKREKVLSRYPEIQQVVRTDLGVVDRCETCHMGINRKGFSDDKIKEPFRTHPEFDILLGRTHPMERFGCTVCHEGQGSQIKGIGHEPFDHGRNDHYWEKPMFEKPFNESTCRKCHKEEWRLNLAPTWDLGRHTFEELGCFGCHITEGFTDPRKVGPELTSIRSKANPGWLVRWIQRPKELRPGTRMPNFWPDAVNEKGAPKDGAPEFKQREEEALAIAAYLWINSSDEIPAPPRTEEIVGDVKRGKSLFMSVGCLGCHRPPALGVMPLRSREVKRDFAPDLSYIGSKANYDWLYSWIRNPKAHWIDTKMPSLRLSKQEAADLAIYLMTLKREKDFPELEVFKPGREQELKELAEKGKAHIKWYGCHGCHDIKGFEKSVKVGAELTAFGSKPTARLDFGDAITDHHYQNWYSWTDLKLKHPRAYKTEKIKLKMPDFSLNGQEIEALMVFLKSLSGEEVPLGYMKRLNKKEKSLMEGERLVNYYNCLGCHRISGKGGDIAALMPDKAFAPPELTGEGSKVQSQWLFRFLKNPTALRPWLTLRMPTFSFTDDEANIIIPYFMALEDEEQYFVEMPEELSGELKVVAEAMFKLLKCNQCHKVSAGGEAQSASNLAPDLAMAKHRLRPDWIKRWLIDPQAIQEGTKMPNFFPLEDDDDPESLTTPLIDLLEGDAKKQIRTIRDYLMLMEEK